MSQSDRPLASAARRPVPPLDPTVRADLVSLLADALVLRFRERTSGMGVSPRGPNHPRTVAAPGEIPG